MIIIIGCDNPNKKIDSLANLESIDPATRIRAIKWAGENKVHNAIPLLVDRLQEQDRTVRFYAIMALRRITGDDLGFDYKADPAQRAEAVKKWRQSLNHK
ncbi:MAG: HEAT repeat domain-containing protein [Planctomycetes bacterium]|nr:HEAT repeat domain-containing protein [Planctomycetota bacterium]